jgi:hypothetical protein
MQSQGTARTPLQRARRLHLSAHQTSHFCIMRHSQSGLGTQTANQAKIIPLTQNRATLALVYGFNSQGFQPDFKIVSVSTLPSYSLGICY